MWYVFIDTQPHAAVYWRLMDNWWRTHPHNIHRQIWEKCIYSLNEQARFWFLTEIEGWYNYTVIQLINQCLSLFNPFAVFLNYFPVNKQKRCDTFMCGSPPTLFLFNTYCWILNSFVLFSTVLMFRLFWT